MQVCIIVLICRHCMYVQLSTLDLIGPGRVHGISVAMQLTDVTL